MNNNNNNVHDPSSLFKPLMRGAPIIAHTFYSYFLYE